MPLRVFGREHLAAGLIALAAAIGLVAVTAAAHAQEGDLEPGSGESDTPTKSAPRDAPWLRGHISAAGWLASLTGTLQTPSGGRPGSTSTARPTTEEIGLDGLQGFPIAEIVLVAIEQHGLRLGLSWIAASGHATLDETLVSQGVTFPAGSQVESELELPIFRIGYRPHWLGLEFAAFRFTPELGIGYTLFDYRLASDDVAGRVSRSYGVGFPYVGVLIERPVGDHLLFEADVAGIGGVNGVSYCDADFRVAWRFRAGERVRPALVAGLRGTWFRRRDDQELEQNDIDVRVGSFSTSPWAGFHFGARVEF